MSVAEVVRASSLAELAWWADGPRASGVVVLLRGETPAVAFTADRAEEARSLAAAPEVVLAVREPRSTGPRWTPIAVPCRPRLVVDADGDVYGEELRLQELHRYPPARRLADSLLLMREHWWYLPRLLVELDPVGSPRRIAPRESPSDVSVIHDGECGLRLRPGRLAEDGVELSTAADAEDGPAVVFSQDASFPDLEVWRRWTWPGRLDGGRFVPGDGPPEGLGREVPAALGLRQRWREERELARACRRGIAAGLG